MRTLARRPAIAVAAAFTVGTLFAAGCGQTSSPTTPTALASVASPAAAVGNGNGGQPPGQARQVDVVVTISKNPANDGDIVTVTAHATVRTSGADVPSEPGALRLQVCADLTFAPLPSAACNGATPTGFWEDLNLTHDTPAVVNETWDTAGQAGKTIGFRGQYIPQGSGYAGANRATDLVVIAKSTPPPNPPPPPPPSTTPLAGTFTGSWTYPLLCGPQPEACSGGVDFGQVYIGQTDSGIGVIQTSGKFLLSFQQLFGGCRFEIDVASGGSFTSTGASLGSQCASYLTFNGSLTSGHLSLTIKVDTQVAWTFNGSPQ